jgi:hypothetical protein
LPTQKSGRPVETEEEEMSNRLAALEEEIALRRDRGEASSGGQVREALAVSGRSASASTRGRRRRKALRRASQPQVSQAAALAAARPISYRVPGSVPLISQPNPLGGWAAALAMLISWREQHSLGIEEALGKLGQHYVDLLVRGAGLPASEKASLLAAAGVIANPPTRYTPEDWEMLLRESGPLWLTDDERAGRLFAMRSLIVVGISGSGSEVSMDVINPASGRQMTKPLDEVIEKIARRRGSRGANRLQVLHLAQGAPNAPTTAPVEAEAAPLSVDLTQFHAFRNGVRWRLTASGVEIEGSGVERTGGEPVTVTRIWQHYGKEINAAATEFNVPCALIIATIAVESGGKADAIRLEPGYVSDAATPGKVSPGLMQTLIATARSALPGEAASIDREWLLVALNSIRAGTAFIRGQAGQTNLDPPMVAAAYNAGGLYHQDGPANRWKMRQFRIGTSEHCDRFVRFFNDAVAMLAGHATRPSVEYATLLGAAAPAPAPDAGAAAQSLPVPAHAFAAIDYDVPGAVPLVTQPSSLQCWAATGTSMKIWKDRTPYTIEQVLAAAGGSWKALYDANHPLSQAEFVAFSRALGLTSEAPMCYDVTGFLRLLQAHGPLWIMEDGGAPSDKLVHAVIATGMHGDGTASGTRVTIVDPLRPAPYSLPWDQLGRQMETPDVVSVGIQVFHF